MLKLEPHNPYGPLILPAKQVFEDVDSGIDLFGHQYFIEPKGVRKQTAVPSDQELTRSDGDLRVATRRFQGSAQRLDMHPAVQRFLYALKKLGVKPEHETPYSCIAQFDVSSNNNPARYRLHLYRGGIWPVVIARGMDSAVVENVRQLDKQVSLLAKVCSIPEREGWQRLKRAMIAIANEESYLESRPELTTTTSCTSGKIAV